MAIFLPLLGIPHGREYNFFAEHDHEKEWRAFISQYFSTGPVLNEKFIQTGKVPDLAKKMGNCIMGVISHTTPGRYNGATRLVKKI